MVFAFLRVLFDDSYFFLSSFFASNWKYNYKNPLREANRNKGERKDYLEIVSISKRSRFYKEGEISNMGRWRGERRAGWKKYGLTWNSASWKRAIKMSIYIYLGPVRRSVHVWKVQRAHARHFVYGGHKLPWHRIRRSKSPVPLYFLKGLQIS